MKTQAMIINHRKQITVNVSERKIKLIFSRTMHIRKIKENHRNEEGIRNYLN